MALNSRPLHELLKALLPDNGQRSRSNRRSTSKNRTLSEEAARHVFDRFKDNDEEVIAQLWSAINPKERPKPDEAFVSNYKECLCLWFEIDYVLNGNKSHDNRKSQGIDLNVTLKNIDDIVKILIQVYKNENDDDLKAKYLAALTSLDQYYRQYLAASIQSNNSLQKTANKISNRLASLTQNGSKSSKRFWIGFFTVVGILAFSALAIIANILTLGLATVITGIVGATISFIGFVVNWIKGRSSSQEINSKIEQNINSDKLEESQHNRDKNRHNELQPKKRKDLIDYNNKNAISRDIFSKRDNLHKSEDSPNKIVNKHSEMEDDKRELMLEGHKLYKFYLDKVSEYGDDYKALIKNEPTLIDTLSKCPVAYSLYNNRENANLLKAILDDKPEIAEIIVGYHVESTSLDLLSLEDILLLTGKSFNGAKILIDDLAKGNLKNIRHLDDQEIADLLCNIATVHGRYRYDFADSVLKIVEDILKNGQHKQHRTPYREAVIRIKNIARQQKDRTICNIVTNKNVANTLIIHLQTKDVSEIVLAYLWDEKDKDFKEAIEKYKGFYADIQFKNKRIFLIPAQVLVDMMNAEEKKNGKFKVNDSSKSSTKNMLTISKGNGLVKDALFNKQNKETFQQWIRDVEEGRFGKKHADNIIASRDLLLKKGYNGKESAEFLTSYHLFHIICSMFDNNKGYDWDFFEEGTSQHKNKSNGSENNSYPYYKAISYS